MHVDAGRVHVAQATRDIEAAGRERPVGDARHVERGELRVVGREVTWTPALVSSAAVSWVSMWVWVSIVRDCRHFVP